MLALYSDYQARRYFTGLDGVRAMAILAVIWHHSGKSAALPILKRGFLGVDLFFVLSGFLIVTLLLREKRLTGQIHLGKFWMRRFLRLMPLYYAILAGLALFYVTIRPDDPDAAAYFNHVWVYALYLSNWIPGETGALDITWSLATEEQFYLVWPVIERFLAPAAALLSLGLFIAANQLMNFGLLDGLLQPVNAAHGGAAEIVAATYTPISLGVLLAYILHHETSYRRFQSLFRFRSGPWIVLAALLLVCTIPGDDLRGFHRLLIQLLMTLFIGSIAIAPHSSLTRVLDHRLVARIGIVSYGMYLLHLWLIQASRAALGSLGLTTTHLTLFLVGSLATYLAAELSFRFYEEPILKIRSRFRPTEPPPPQPG